MKLSTNAINRILLTVILLFIMVFAYLIYAKLFYSVAVINGHPIRRSEYFDELDSRYGMKTLDTIVTETIIYQEAKKRNVKVSKKEIDAAMKKLAGTFNDATAFDAALSEQGLNRTTMEERLTLNKLLETMVRQDIKITDKDIDTYINSHKSEYPGKKVSTEKRNEIKEILIKTQLPTQIQIFVADLRKKAEIEIHLP